MVAETRLLVTMQSHPGEYGSNASLKQVRECFQVPERDSLWVRQEISLRPEGGAHYVDRDKWLSVSEAIRLKSDSPACQALSDPAAASRLLAMAGFEKCGSAWSKLELNRLNREIVGREASMPRLAASLAPCVASHPDRDKFPKFSTVPDRPSQLKQLEANNVSDWDQHASAASLRTSYLDQLRTWQDTLKPVLVACNRSRVKKGEHPGIRDTPKSQADSVSSPKSQEGSTPKRDSGQLN